MGEYTIPVYEGIYTAVIADWKLDIREVEYDFQRRSLNGDDLMRIHALMVEGRRIFFEGRDLSAITFPMQDDMFSSFSRLNELERSITQHRPY